MQSSSSAFETIHYDNAGATAHITINRPQLLNALSGQTIAELRTAFEGARDDLAIRGVILTGAGDKAFAAGADIAELAQATPIEAAMRSRAGQALLDLIETLGKPVIAAVNGLALGGGCEIAMACTFRLAVPGARFGQPEIKLGLIPGYGGTQRLARLIGKGAALRLILTGEMINAAEALRLGLVEEIVEPAELLPRATAILTRIAANAPLAVGYALEAVNRGLDGPLGEGLALERGLFALCAATEDKQEGTSAFLQKRPPRFQGR